MKYINNYQDYLKEYKQFINHENSEIMNEGWKHWLASFLMLVNLGIVPPRLIASTDDQEKMEFVQDINTIEQVANKFESYFNKNKFYNTPKYAWEDFQNVYGKSAYDLNDILEKTNISSIFFSVDKEIPNPTNYINDYAELIPSEKNEIKLNKIISDYEKQSGMEIAIVTVNKLTDDTYLSSVSHDIFRKWGIGKDGADNGILITISEKDRNWNIQTGYGAEIVLTDNICYRLGNNVLVPEFKSGNYEKGIEDLINAIIKHIGTNSDDIKRFQENYERQKAENLANIKDFFINALYIIGLLSIIGFLIGFGIKKQRKIKELKEESKKILDQISLIINQFEKDTQSTKEVEYIRNIITKFNEQLDDLKELPNKPTSNEKSIELLSNNVSILYNLLQKVGKFNDNYKIALNTKKYIVDVKNLLSYTEQLNNDLSEYNIIIKQKNIPIDEIEKAESKLKTNMNSENIFNYVPTFLGLVSLVKNNYNELKQLKDSIPGMEKTINQLDKNIEQWIKDLEYYKLSNVIDQLNKKLPELENKLNSNNLNIIEKYKQYNIIKDFVYKSIDNEKSRLRKIEDDKRRKKQEEEDEERRRRNSYYSSSSSSSSYSSSSSSFGGFGGGSSGGGGAGGSF